MRYHLVVTLPVVMFASLLSGGNARAADIVVMSSGGFYSAIEELAPVFEKASGHKVILVSGSSMGSSPTAIPARIQRGEPADLLIDGRHRARQTDRPEPGRPR